MTVWDILNALARAAAEYPDPPNPRSCGVHDKRMVWTPLMRAEQPKEQQR